MNQTMNGAQPSGSCRCKTTLGLSGANLKLSRKPIPPMQRYTLVPLSAPKISLGHIPTGWRGTQKTVEHVQSLIRSGAKDFYVRQKAIDILLESQVKPKDYLAEIKALFEWVQRHIRYTKDTFQVEVLHSARRMLELRAGDCDDMTILLGAMLEAIGHPVRLILSGPD
ncbi:MAG TPA: transglutaminase-like domain-containing protein, partial [Nitrospira sp.]|nr:transglutaminase-like domain-containing protein [Nitrospira sp.]